MKLCLDHGIEYFENRSNFRFFSHKEYVGNSCVIINKKYKPPNSDNVSDSGRSPYIVMNYYEWFKRFIW